MDAMAEMPVALSHHLKKHGHTARINELGGWTCNNCHPPDESAPAEPNLSLVADRHLMAS